MYTNMYICTYAHLPMLNICVCIMINSHDPLPNTDCVTVMSPFVHLIVFDDK